VRLGGEALPPQIAKSWKERTGLEILDGIGSTEMLHIFLSNRPSDLRHGTTGKPVPGYERAWWTSAATGQAGEMESCRSAGRRAPPATGTTTRKPRHFHGGWTKSGDKYSLDRDGYYVYGGRSDDMLKVSGIYVSPAEVEAALITHEAVLEAAVVGAEDESKLIKPKPLSFSSRATPQATP